MVDRDIICTYVDLAQKSIPIESAATSIYLPNDTIISQMNKTPLLHGGENYLPYTAQAREFGIAFHDAAKHHGVKAV